VTGRLPYPGTEVVEAVAGGPNRAAYVVERQACVFVAQRRSEPRLPSDNGARPRGTGRVQPARDRGAVDQVGHQAASGVHSEAHPVAGLASQQQHTRR